jgi:two-component system sensor histidine kinase AtoS
MRLLRGRSIRAHILLIVLLGAIVPLTLIGVWVTRNAIHSGRDLLRAQLDASAETIVAGIRSRWSYREGELLLLAENQSARRIVGGAAAVPTSADSAYLAGMYFRVARSFPSFLYRDADGREVWSTTSLPAPAVSAPARQGTSQPTVGVTLPTRDDRGRLIGHLEARIALDALIPDSGRFAVPGGAVTVRDATTGTTLIAGVAPATAERDGEFRRHDTTWMVVRRSLTQPRLDLSLAAPTAAYVTPFESTARLGFVAVILVAAVALGLSAYLTTRLTRPLEQLVEASTAVTEGDLERRVALLGGEPREISKLATSFNSMTESLKRTMGELSRRSALAAVGEFAASLAHEVRNSLTSVKVDLQRAEEKLPHSEPAAPLVNRSLAALTNLDAVVTGALRVARSGTVSTRDVDLSSVIASAASSAAPTFAMHDAVAIIDQSAAGPLSVNGDSAAPHQLFLNLLMNAAQSLPAGGRASVSARRENGHLLVAVSDTGAGIPEQDLSRVLDPFYSTRPQGTGLGLPIARQIAVAHGGEVSVQSRQGEGTVVTVKLPALEAADA